MKDPEMVSGATTYNAGDDASPWTEIRISVPADRIDDASAIAQMTVPYGIYIEDYRDLEDEVEEIAHIDLIDEDLLQKDRTKGIIHIYIEPGENPAEAVAFLNERYAASGIPSTLTTIPCRREDWQDNWKKYFKPMKVGSRLLIQPSWEDAPSAEADGRRVLHLEPGLAFGTGTHETTRLCLQTLEETIRGGETVLDLGCGSGILSIASLLLEAKEADAVDIDPNAINIAYENSDMNDIPREKYHVCAGNILEDAELHQKYSGKKYDMVEANIVADIIIALTKQVPDYIKDGGIFLSSGIITERKEDVLAALEAGNFKVEAIREKNGWVAIASRFMG